MKHTRHLRLLTLPLVATVGLATTSSIAAGRPATAGAEPPPDAGEIAVSLVAARLGIDPADLQVVNVADTSLAAGERPIVSAKVIDPEGAIYGVAFDDGGKEVDLDALVADSRRNQRERFGAVDPALDAALQAAPDDRRPVLIWLAGASSELPPRPDANGVGLDPAEIDKVLAEIDARRLDVVAPIVDAVLADVARYDDAAVGLAPTPAIAATLDARAIAELAHDERIDTIYDAPAAAEELAAAKQATGVDRVHGTGITGAGVRVGVIETGGRAEQSSLLLRPIVQDPLNVCATPTTHTTNVTSVIVGRRLNFFGQLVGEDGVAFGSDVRVGGSCANLPAELQTAATRAANWGARVLNLSFGSDTNLAVGGQDRFFDDLVHNRWRTVAKSAGNRACPALGNSPADSEVTSPGLGYNVVTVGGFNDAGTGQWSDDTMYSCSSFGDPISTHNDREKPELAAPGANITLVDPGPANMSAHSGTSFAAPHVAGTTALLMQKNSRLAIWPEIVRAILMASATHNIEGATRLSDQDGAGGLVADRAAGIVENPAAWNGVRFDCSTPRTLDLTTRGVGPRTHHRVAISWTTDPSFSDYTNRPSADIDLQVVNPLGQVVASSSSWDNTSEIVEFDSWTAGTFTVRAVNFRCDLPTYVGWAWDTQPMRTVGQH